MSLAILFRLLCAQHVSDFNISIFRSLRLCWWITTSVVLFSVRCVLELFYGWYLVVFVLQAEAIAILLWFRIFHRESTGKPVWLQTECYASASFQADNVDL